MKLTHLKDSDPIQLILKLPGDECNLRCSYCYEKQREYKEHKFLDEITLAQCLQYFGSRNISIQFHGGEPLVLGIERMRRLLEVIQNYPGKTRLSIQTNAIALNEQWLNFFDTYCPQIEIGISLDGDFYSNEFRKTAEGQNSFYSVNSAIQLCESRKRSIGIISVVTKRSLHRAEEILTLFSQFSNIKAVNFMACINEKTETCDTVWETSPAEYTAFIQDVFQYWEKNELYKKFIIDPIYSIIRTAFDEPSLFCHFSDMKCTNIFTLYPDGSLTFCDELINEKAVWHQFSEKGAVVYQSKEDGRSQDENQMIQDINQLNVKCNKCDYFPLCRGGCCGSRLRFSKSEREFEYCSARAQLIDFILSNIGRTPINSVPARDNLSL